MMRSNKTAMMKIKTTTATMLVLLSALGFGGCAVVGPQSIAAGRGVYAEVINRTEDEQILNAIVRQRYDETFGMMSVASVTANLNFSAQAGANIGIGDSDNYAGNLVPLSAGVAYEENPTISYVPLKGEDFMQRMLSPVAANQWLLLAGTTKHPGDIFDMAVRRINKLRNPLLGRNPPSRDFARLVELYDRLRRAGVLDIVRPPKTKTETESDFFWDFHDYEDAHGDSVREFLKLLGIEVKPDGSEILLPVRRAVGSSTSAVHVQTRSAFDILQVFGAGIDIPPPHLQAGIVEPVIWAVPAKRRIITIRSSEKRPDNATVRIRFRDRWFYIDATDTRSKRAFVFLQTFIGMRLADPGAAQRAPIITIPAN
ncbi:MAG: hypothetical protein KJP23_22750 [Deltaproteobacteria bacterium]|nr:hypothetical protein [Deltaproteobacteria bacterium]